MILLAIAVAFLQIASGDKDMSAYDKAYDKAFRANYRTHGIEKCVDHLKKDEPNDSNIPRWCACVIETFLATKTVTELDRGLTDDEIHPIGVACLKMHPPPP